MCHDLTQQPSLHIPLDYHNSVIVLQSRCDECSVPVERESTWVPATSGGGLNQRQVARRGVDSVGDQRVGGKSGAVRWVEVRDGQGVLASRGDGQEVVVGLIQWSARALVKFEKCITHRNDNLGRFGSLWRATSRPVYALVEELGQVYILVLTSQAVIEPVPRDTVVQFIHCVEVGKVIVSLKLCKGTMTRARARYCLDRRES